MIDVANRVRMSLRAKSLNFIESKLGACSDYQVIIINSLAVVEFKLVLVGMDTFHTRRNELDTLAFQIFTYWHLNLSPFTPFNGNPGIGRNKLEILAI